MVLVSNTPDAYLRTLGLSGEDLRSAIGEEYVGDTSQSAVNRLEARLSKPRAQVSFLGITVPGEGVHLIGMCAILLGELYLAAHIRQLAVSLLHEPLESASTVRVMPWVGLMPGVLGVALTVVFVGVVPLSATAMAVWRVVGAGRFPSIPSILLFLGIAGGAYWAVAKTLAVRKALKIT
jgi:hypothetical protein